MNACAVDKKSDASGDREARLVNLRSGADAAHR